MKSDRVELLMVFIFILIPPNIFVKCYVVKLTEVKNTPGDAVVPTLRIVGPNRALNGTIIMLDDLTDDYLVKIELFSDTQRNGDYKPMALKLPILGICTSIRKHYEQFIKDSIVSNINTNLDFLNGNVCPIPKGDYWIQNVIFDTKNWLGVLPTGFIKVKLSVLKNKVVVGGFSIIVSIEYI